MIFFICYLITVVFLFFPFLFIISDYFEDSEQAVDFSVFLAFIWPISLPIFIISYLLVGLWYVVEYMFLYLTGDPLKPIMDKEKQNQVEREHMFAIGPQGIQGEPINVPVPPAPKQKNIKYSDDKDVLDL